MNMKPPEVVAAETKRPAAPRLKVTYDLIPGLSTRIQAIAQQLQCSQSDVAVHLLAKGLMAFDAGQMNLRAIRRPHASRQRFAYKLPIPRLSVPVATTTQQTSSAHPNAKEVT